MGSAGGEESRDRVDGHHLLAFAAAALLVGGVAVIVVGVGPAAFPGTGASYPDPATAPDGGTGPGCGSVVIYSRSPTGRYGVVLDVDDRLTTRTVRLAGADARVAADHPRLGSGVDGVAGYVFDFGDGVQVAGLVQGNYVNPSYDLDRRACVGPGEVVTGEVLGADWEALLGEAVGSSAVHAGAGGRDADARPGRAVRPRE